MNPFFVRRMFFLTVLFSLYETSNCFIDLNFHLYLRRFIEQPKKVTARVTKGKAKAAAPVKVKAAKKKAEAPADSAEQSAAKPKPKRQARKAVAKENNNVQEEKVEPKKRANKRAAVKQPQPEEEDEISEENAAEEPTGKRGRKAPAPAKPLNRTDTNYENVSFSCTRKNAKGEEYNLKISSWNVDGLRSWLKKGGTEFLEKEQPDVLCLQETKCSASKIPEELKDVKGRCCLLCFEVFR